MKNKNKIKHELLSIAVIIVSAFVTAFAFHVFILSNGFLPGGVTGLGALTGKLAGFNAGYFSFLFNLPILVCVFFLIKKSSAIHVFCYVALQSAGLLIFELVSFPTYETEHIIVAAIGGGVISGLGFALMLKYFGISGGTYAIGTLLQRKNPTLNIVWLSFIMDSVVVFAAFFVYGFDIEAAICTFINLFIANKVSDIILQGFKIGYKYEIITKNPDELSQEIIETLGVSTTRISVEGMYSHEESSQLVCIIRKRHIGEMQRIIKKYSDTFTTISKVNDYIGGRVGKKE